MLRLFMEPFDYLINDPGLRVLLIFLVVVDNIKCLEWMLGRFIGYVGVINYMGSKFITLVSDMWLVFEVLCSCGLLFVDSRSSQCSVVFGFAKDLCMLFVVNSCFIDNEVSCISIDV